MAKQGEFGEVGMRNVAFVRLGGIFGLLAVAAIIPAYVVGYPDSAGSAREAGAYFAEGVGTFTFANGVLPLFHTFFFILFLGALCSMLRSAEDRSPAAGGLYAAALAGGIVYATLSAAGFAAEIVYPAAFQRFGDFEPDTAFVLVSLALASWLYHFCQVGTSVMVLATSLAALGTGVLPRLLALAGLLVALLALLHFLLPLLAALSGLAWIAVVSLLMLAGGAEAASSPRTRDPRAPTRRSRTLE